MATELAHQTQETDSLRQVQQQWQVPSRERTVLVAAQNVAPLDPAAPVDESVHVAVVAPHVVGAEVHRAVCGLADTATDVRRDE